MKKLLILTVAMLALVGVPAGLQAQKGFEVVKGKAFDNAIPNDFYLEGNRIPTNKMNSVLVKTPTGARVLFGTLNTTGYSSQIQQKYEGMIISESHFTLCGQKIGVGSFGFGHTKPLPTSNEDMKLTIYDQAGTKVAECSGKKDASLKQPVPLQVLNDKLYLGRHAFDLK